MIELNVNGQRHQAEVDGDTPLLWVLREEFQLTGTKYGCGVAQCGACTVHMDGAAVRSCLLPVSAVTRDNKLLTIEGLGDTPLKVVQQVWAELDVAQCGYCQPGMMMAAAAFITETPRPTDEDVRTGITNICRCGTYPRVLAAVKLAAQRLHQGR